MFWYWCWCFVWWWIGCIMESDVGVIEWVVVDSFCWVGEMVNIWYGVCWIWGWFIVGWIGVCVFFFCEFGNSCCFVLVIFWGWGYCFFGFWW